MSPIDPRPLLEIVGVDKSFGSNQVLKRCSLNVMRMQTVVIIGPSGSGKSTFLRCMNLLEPVDSGNIFFDGKDITGERKTAHRVRQQIGMVFQSFELFQHLSVVENIMLAPVKVLGMTSPLACWGRSTFPRKPKPFPTSFPAANSNASQLRARSR
jgi:polar amino acid transport system ATP-binding protein